MKFYKQIQQLVNSLQKNLECSVCLELLSDPVQTTCGHHFCRKCVLKVLQTKRTALCPLCKKLMSKRGLRDSNKLLKLVTGTQHIIQAVENDTQSSVIAVSAEVHDIPFHKSEFTAYTRKRTSDELESFANEEPIQESYSKKQRTSADGINKGAVNETGETLVPVSFASLKKENSDKDSWKRDSSAISNPSTFGFTNVKMLQDEQHCTNPGNQLAKYIAFENLGGNSSLIVSEPDTENNCSQSNNVDSVLEHLDAAPLKVLGKKQRFHQGLIGAKNTDMEIMSGQSTRESTKLCTLSHAETAMFEGNAQKQQLGNPSKYGAEQADNTAVFKITTDKEFRESKDIFSTISSQEKVHNWLQKITGKADDEPSFTSTSSNKFFGDPVTPILKHHDGETCSESLILATKECNMVQTELKATDNSIPLHSMQHCTDQKKKILKSLGLSSSSFDESVSLQDVEKDNIAHKEKLSSSIKNNKFQLPLSETNASSIHSDPYEYIPSQEIQRKKKTVHRRNKENMTSNKSSAAKNTRISKSRQLPDNCSAFDALFEPTNLDGYDASSEDDLLLNLFVTPKGNNLSHVNKRQSARRYTRNRKCIKPTAHSTQMPSKMLKNNNDAELKAPKMSCRRTKKQPVLSDTESEINSLVVKLSEAESHVLTVVNGTQLNCAVANKALPDSSLLSTTVYTKSALISEDVQELGYACNMSNVLCSDGKTGTYVEKGENQLLLESEKESRMSKTLHKANKADFASNTINSSDEQVDIIDSDHNAVTALTVEHALKSDLHGKPKLVLDAGEGQLKGTNMGSHCGKFLNNTDDSQLDSQGFNLPSTSKPHTDTRLISQIPVIADKEEKKDEDVTVNPGVSSVVTVSDLAVEELRQCLLPLDTSKNTASCNVPLLIADILKPVQYSSFPLQARKSTLKPEMCDDRVMHGKLEQTDNIQSTIDFVSDTYNKLSHSNIASAKEVTGSDPPATNHPESTVVAGFDPHTTNLPESVSSLCTSLKQLDNTDMKSKECVYSPSERKPFGSDKLKEHIVLHSRQLPSIAPTTNDKELETHIYSNNETQMHSMPTTDLSVENNVTSKKDASYSSTQPSPKMVGLLKPSILMKLEENSHKPKTRINVSDRELQTNSKTLKTSPYNKLVDKDITMFESCECDERPEKFIDEQVCSNEKFYPDCPPPSKSLDWSHAKQMCKDFNLKSKPVLLNIEEKSVQRSNARLLHAKPMNYETIVDRPFSIDASSCVNVSTESSIPEENLLQLANCGMVSSIASDSAKNEQKVLIQDVVGQKTANASEKQSKVFEKPTDLHDNGEEVLKTHATQNVEDKSHKTSLNNDVDRFRCPDRKTFALDVDTQELEFIEKPNSTLEMNSYFSEALPAKPIPTSCILGYNTSVQDPPVVSSDTNEWISPTRSRELNAKVLCNNAISVCGKLLRHLSPTCCSFKECEAGKTDAVIVKDESTLSNEYNSCISEANAGVDNTLKSGDILYANVHSSLNTNTVLNYSAERNLRPFSVDNSTASVSLCKLHCLDFSSPYCTKFYQLGKLHASSKHNFHSVATQTESILTQLELPLRCIYCQKIPFGASATFEMESCKEDCLKTGQIRKVVRSSSEVNTNLFLDSTKISGHCENVNLDSTVQSINDSVNVDISVTACPNQKIAVHSVPKEDKSQGSFSDDCAHFNASGILIDNYSQHSQTNALVDGSVAHYTRQFETNVSCLQEGGRRACDENLCKYSTKHLQRNDHSLAIVSQALEDGMEVDSKPAAYDNVHNSACSPDGRSQESTQSTHANEQSDSAVPQFVRTLIANATSKTIGGHSLGVSHLQNPLKLEKTCFQSSKHISIQQHFSESAKHSVSDSHLQSCTNMGGGSKNSSPHSLPADCLQESSRPVLNYVCSRDKQRCTSIDASQNDLISRRTQTLQDDISEECMRHVLDSCSSRVPLQHQLHHTHTQHSPRNPTNVFEGRSSQDNATDNALEECLFKRVGSSTSTADGKLNTPLVHSVLVENVSQDKPKKLVLIDDHSHCLTQDILYDHNNTQKNSSRTLEEGLKSGRIMEDSHDTVGHSSEETVALDNNPSTPVDFTNTLPSSNKINNFSCAESSIVKGSVDTPQDLSPYLRHFASNRETKNGISGTTDKKELDSKNRNEVNKHKDTFGGSDTENSVESVSYSVLQEPDPKKIALKYHSEKRAYFGSLGVDGKAVASSDMDSSDSSSPVSKLSNNYKKTKRGIAQRLSPINFEDCVMPPYRPNVVDVNFKTACNEQTTQENEEIVDLEAEFVPPTPPVSCLNTSKASTVTELYTVGCESITTLGNNNEALQNKAASRSKQARLKSLPDLLQAVKPIKKHCFKRIRKICDFDSSSSESNSEEIRPVHRKSDKQHEKTVSLSGSCNSETVRKVSNNGTTVSSNSSNVVLSPSLSLLKEKGIELTNCSQSSNWKPSKYSISNSKEIDCDRCNLVSQDRLVTQNEFVEAINLDTDTEELVNTEKLNSKEYMEKVLDNISKDLNLVNQKTIATKRGNVTSNVVSQSLKLPTQSQNNGDVQLKATNWHNASIVQEKNSKCDFKRLNDGLMDSMAEVSSRGPLQILKIKSEAISDSENDSQVCSEDLYSSCSITSDASSVSSCGEVLDTQQRTNLMADVQQMRAAIHALEAKLKQKQCRPTTQTTKHKTLAKRRRKSKQSDSCSVGSQLRINSPSSGKSSNKIKFKENNGHQLHQSQIMASNTYPREKQTTHKDKRQNTSATRSFSGESLSSAGADVTGPSEQRVASERVPLSAKKGSAGKVCKEESSWATNKERVKEMDNKKPVALTTGNCQEEMDSGFLSFVTTKLQESEARKVQELANLVKASYCKTFNKNTTHVIVKTGPELKCERTLKYFQGIAGKKWVVSYLWVKNSLQQGRLLPEENYEVIGDTYSGTYHGPKRARTLEDNFLKGFEICCLGPFPDITRDQFSELVEMSGATLVFEPSMFPYNPSKRQIIVVQKLLQSIKNHNELLQRYQAISIHRDWLLDSIVRYSALPFDNYMLSDPLPSSSR